MKFRTVISISFILCFLAAVAAAQSSASSDTDSGPAIGPATISAAPGVAPAEPGPPPSAMSLPRAIILGAVEGITEFLPVSSTGHLLIAERLFGMGSTDAEKEASDAYAIVIQLGAILAVIVVSSRRIGRMFLGIFGKNRQGLDLAGNILVSFVPAALMGLFLEGMLKKYLFDPWHVAIAWLVGGIFILAAMRKRGAEGGLPLEELGWKRALVIGLAQCFALWPGVSRSLVTMAGGMLLGLSVSAAVEYSFLLGLVTLGAATLYEGIRRGHLIVQYFGWLNPIIGLLVAGVTAFLAVRWMIAYLRTRSPIVFGWYRIAIGAAVVVLVIGGKM
jgi:undecaprenyl-diphosphatase